MTVLDSSMLGVALPGIARELGISPAAATWLLNAYQLTVVTTLLPLASLGESIGFRRVFLLGFGLFAGASLGAALVAHSFEALLGFRILQGLGASAVMSLTAGLIRHTYPARQLGRAIGVNALVVAVSGASAPSLAAAILAFAPWPALFAVNVVPSLIGIVIGLRALPRVAGSGRSFDAASAVLNIATFGMFFLGPRPAAASAAAGGAAAGRGDRRRLRAGEAAIVAAGAAAAAGPAEDAGDRHLGRRLGLRLLGLVRGLHLACPSCCRGRATARWRRGW